MSDRSDIDPETGMTKAETLCAQELQAAYDRFQLLSVDNPEEKRDFAEGIRRCHGVIAMRAVQRIYPLGWRCLTSHERSETPGDKPDHNT